MTQPITQGAPHEEWRTIADLLRYEVSSLGRVRNRETGHLLLLRKNYKGYIAVQLWDRGKSKTTFVSRLICAAWHGPMPFPGAQAAHLDGDKLNNVPGNVAWVTCSENNLHKHAHGTFARPAKLSEREVLEIYRSSEPTSVLAATYNVQPNTIRNIVYGRQWTRVTKSLGRGRCRQQRAGQPAPQGGIDR
jgi:hypothetical protein